MERCDACDGLKGREGWGTALKPAWEPVIVARKPLIGTVAANVLAHGTGGINVDGCRIAATDKTPAPVGQYSRPKIGMTGHSGVRDGSADHLGRWPANLILDESTAAALDEMSGTCRSSGLYSATDHGREGARSTSFGGRGVPATQYADRGGASRFFYCAKPSRAERNNGGPNRHPTVKPIALMRHLVRLVTPPGGLVLDPFTGSGTTGCAARLEGFRFVGCEMDPEHAELARSRIAAVEPEPEQADLSFGAGAA